MNETIRQAIAALEQERDRITAAIAALVPLADNGTNERTNERTKQSRRQKSSTC